jgi:membrane fusion protein
MKRDEIFLRQALQARGQQYLGEIEFTESARLARLPARAAFALLLLSIGVLFIPVPRSIAVSGSIASDPYRVTAPAMGTVQRQFVTVGQVVAEGDPLFIVSSDGASGVLPTTLKSLADEAAARVASIRTEDDAHRMASQFGAAQLASKLDAKKAEVALLHSQIESGEAQLALRIAGYERYKTLEQFFGKAQLDQQLETVMRQRQELTEFRRRYAAAQAEMKQFSLEIGAANSQMQEWRSAKQRELSRAHSDLAEIEARRATTVRAPRAGTISSISVPQGQNVSANSEVMTLRGKEQQLVAELDIPNHAIAFIKRGALLRLHLDALPYQRYGEAEAVVEQVSSEARRSGAALGFAGRARLLEESSAANGVQSRLVSGMTFQAYLKTDRQPVWYWILEPLWTRS